MTALRGATAPTPASPARARAPARRKEPPHRGYRLDVARLAVGCLHAELTLHPKPGLVSPIDNGSHHDMTAATFMRSLFALRRFFIDICQAGIDDAPFAVLQQLGVEAERRMLRATGGVNTHRGAIFCLGLLCAAAGRARAQGVVLSAASLRAVLLISWGEALAGHALPPAAPLAGASHGQQAALRHAASGAREEGALGFPSLFEVGLPALQATVRAGRGMRLARIDALFALMAHVSDTNVYHRGGRAGALTVKRQAQCFLARGGTAAPDWYARALACHRRLVRRRLSPGGCADLLAATCLAHALIGRAPELEP